MELKGITLVISPLLALMKEQVDELNDKRKINSLALNSSISFEDQREILRNLKSHSYKLIYVSPERLQNPFFRASLLASGVKIEMIVVDEAHCISQWGGGFRPDYSQINSFIEFLKVNNHLSVQLCLTATLSKRARKDIATEFKVKKENIVSENIYRKNLKLNFLKVSIEKEKSLRLKEFLEKYHPQKTIAYLYSKRKCEDYSEEFASDFNTDYYHADVDSEEKGEVYKRFLDNKIQILFATTAFGMGINIPDIESIVHIQIPNSIEEYYQQVGRGWRNKQIPKDCNCLVLWSDVNFEARKKEVAKEKYTLEDLRKAFNVLVGEAELNSAGQIVNKDKAALVGSDFNLQLLRYKLEEHKIIRTIGETNGTPLTIELNANTKLWSKIVKCAKDGMDSFIYVSHQLDIPITKIIAHLYEQDLKGNIKKIPAIKRDLYFEILILNLTEDICERIIKEINFHIDYRIKQLDDLRELFLSGNYEINLNEALN